MFANLYETLKIGVITPYEGQRAYIVNYMSRNGSLRQQLYKEIEVCSMFADALSVNFVLCMICSISLLLFFN